MTISRAAVTRHDAEFAAALAASSSKGGDGWGGGWSGGGGGMGGYDDGQRTMRAVDQRGAAPQPAFPNRREASSKAETETENDFDPTKPLFTSGTRAANAKSMGGFT